jgi:hypothetical protein
MMGSIVLSFVSCTAIMWRSSGTKHSHCRLMKMLEQARGHVANRLVGE